MLVHCIDIEVHTLPDEDLTDKQVDEIAALLDQDWAGIAMNLIKEHAPTLADRIEITDDA